MLIALLSYLPIPLAPLTAIALVLILQRLLRLPREPDAAPTADAIPSVPAAANPPEPTWETVTHRWNPLITGVLPILTSVAIVLLGLWPFAYLGNVIMRASEARPGWAEQVPPWFGNIGYFLGLGAFGLLMAILGTVGRPHRRRPARDGQMPRVARALQPLR